MTLRIYGIARSRAIRTLWMAHELGLSYEHIETGFGPEGTRSAAFLALNPNGHVPAIDDDGLVLWESLAINLYLARKHGGPLAPASAAEDGLMTSWGFWSAIAIEPHAATAMYNTHLYPEADRRPELVHDALARLQAPLAVLEVHLATHGGHLVGGRFTVADLNLIGCLFYLRFNPEALTNRPAIRAYYAEGLARPAARAAWALRGE
jgi:glutathione S-transferase